MPLKKILLIIPNLGFGGAQKVFYDHSKYLSQFYEVTECVFNYDQDRVYNSGNKLVALNVGGGGNVIRKACNFLLRVYRLRKLKMAYAFDICISHLEGADYINILSRGDEKVICCIHGSKLYDQNIQGIMGWLRKNILIAFLYKKSDTLVTVSDDIRHEMINSFGQQPEKIYSIPNFFDLENIAKKSLENPDNPYGVLFETHKIVIAASRFAKQKNLFSLLEVWEKVLLTSENVKLVILGDGEQRNQLLEFSRSLKLKTYSSWDNNDFSLEYDVYFPGFTDNPSKYIKRSSLFVLPSSWEGFPMILCEALAVGSCVLAADCPTGPRQILNEVSTASYNLMEAEFGKYGILMPVVNEFNRKAKIKEWAEVINRVICDENTINRYKKQGKERIGSYNENKVMQQWKELLEMEISKHGRAKLSS